MIKRKNMIAGFVVALLAVSVIAHAEQADEDSSANSRSIELLVGPMFPLTKVKNGSAEDDLGSEGFALGGRFMKRVKPEVSIGAEIQSLNSGDHSSTILIPNAETTSSYNSYVFLAEMKLEDDLGSIKPFLIGGIGFDSTQMTGSATPLPGYAWVDTGTRETRGLSSTQTSFAGTLQGGINVPIDDQLFVGISIAWYYCGHANYAGLASGSIASLSMLADIGYRF